MSECMLVCRWSGADYDESLVLRMYLTAFVLVPLAHLTDTTTDRDPL